MKVSYRPAEKVDDPESDGGLKVDYSAAKRPGYLFRWYLLVLVVLAPISLVAYVYLRPVVMVIAPGIVTTEPLEMRSPIAGLVEILVVRSGESVAAGDDLLVVMDQDFNAEIEALTRQSTEMKERSVRADNRIIEQLIDKRDVARDGLLQQAELRRTYEEFKDQGAIPVADMARVIEAYTAARLTLEQAEVELRLEEQRQEIQQRAGLIAQASNRIELRLARLRSQQQQGRIMAPFTSHVVDVRVQSGERVSVDQPLLLLAGRDKAVIHAYIDPRYADYTRIGQAVEVRLPNGEKFQASIKEPSIMTSRVPPQLSRPFAGERPALKVTITPDQARSFPVEGMPVEVVFDRDWWIL